MEIIWRPSALRDLEEARHYIAQNNPAAANRVRGAIMTAVGRLADMPGLGRPGRVEHTRELVVAGTPYIVAYTVISDEVIILAVIHGARRWPERL
jgi:toxin ParE1/3/4